MHGQSNRAEHAVRPVHQSNQFSQSRAPDQVDHAPQFRMPMVRITALHELDSAPKMIDNGLIRVWIPPFRGEIVFTAADHNPVIA